MSKECLLVDTPLKMRIAVDDLNNSNILSVDTEYDSMRYFREKLCLIQVMTASAFYIFDPLNSIDLNPLGKCFANPGIVKIFHSADNDIRYLKRDYGYSFENIFDTHRAAYLLGLHQLSLERIVFHFLGIELKKSKKLQRSRWDKRPLTDEQLRYALEDVQYLPDLYQAQLAQLNSRKVMETAKIAFSKIAASSWQEKKLDRRGYVKIAGYYSFDLHQKEILKKLYFWRFQRAKEADRAIFMFMSDKTLAQLAQTGKNWRETLSEEKARIFGEELEAIIDRN